MQLTDSDYEVLRLEAESRGVSVETLLQEYGHLLQPEPAPVQKPVSVVEAKPAPTATPPEPVKEPTPVPEFDVLEVDEDGNVLFTADESSDSVASATMPDLPPELDETPAAAPASGVVAAQCAYCGMDPLKPAYPVPSREDKILFLHCLLGETVFKKSYAVFGGKIRFAFRMLRTTELDYLYQEAFRAQRRGLLTSSADYYTFLRGLRVYVQLAEVTTAFGIRLTLPGGLTQASSPDAAQTWDMLCPEDPENKDLTLLERIQRYINREVLRSEAVLESAKELCEEFNKLIMVLELNKNNDPFWKETDTPP